MVDLATNSRKQESAKYKTLIKLQGVANSVAYLAEFSENSARRLEIETPVCIRINPRLRKTFGLYFPRPSDTSKIDASLAMAYIEISGYIVKDVLELRETVFHEMCHHKTEERGEGKNHDGVWRKYMSVLGLRPDIYTYEPAIEIHKRHCS